MTLISSIQKPLLMLIIFGSMRVHQQFSMTTPPTPSTPAVFDTTTIVPKDHPLEVLASLGNKFLTLATTYQDLSHVWTGETTANPTRTQAYLANEFLSILYLSEERIPRLIERMLNTSFGAVRNISLTTIGEVDNFVKSSQNSFKAFLVSKEKSNLERNAIMLKEMITNLRRITGTSVLKSTELNEISNRFAEIKKNVDDKQFEAGIADSTFRSTVLNGEIALNQTAQIEREHAVLLIKDAQNSFGKARAALQVNIEKEAATGAAAWANPAITNFLPTVAACPVDGRAKFVTARTTTNTLRTALLATVSTPLTQPRADFVTLNTTLNGVLIKSNVTQTICRNLNEFVVPRTSSNNSTLRPTGTAPPSPVNAKNMTAIAEAVGDFVFTVTTSTILNTAHTASDATRLTETQTKITAECQGLLKIFELRSNDLINFKRLETLISSLLTRAAALRTAFNAKMLEALPTFFPVTATDYQIPAGFVFPEVHSINNNFVKPFHTSASANAAAFFVLARQYNDLNDELNRFFNTLSQNLQTILRESAVFNLLRDGLSFTNEVLRPSIFFLLNIDNDLVRHHEAFLQTNYERVAKEMKHTSNLIRNDTLKIDALKSFLTTNETAIRLSNLRATAHSGKVETINTMAASKFQTMFTKVMALTNIAVTAVNAFSPPSTTVIYRHNVIRFNQTNCFNVSNLEIKGANDAVQSAFFCPIDLRGAGYGANPKILLSTIWRVGNATLSNGVTSLPSVNPILINHSTNNAVDGTTAGLTYLKIIENGVPVFKQYQVSLVSVSSTLIIVKVVLPYIASPSQILDQQTNSLKDLAQTRIYESLHINVTTTA